MSYGWDEERRKQKTRDAAFAAGLLLTVATAGLTGIGYWAWQSFPFPDLSSGGTGDGAKFDNGKAPQVPALEPTRSARAISVNGRKAQITFER